MKRTSLRRISDRQRARLAAYAKVRKAWWISATER